MNKREALKTTAELWRWLADNPKRQKYQWPGWRTYRKTHGTNPVDCPLCDYTGFACEKCPLYKKWLPRGRLHSNAPCTDFESLFSIWGVSEKRFPAIRALAAAEIVKMCEGELEKLYKKSKEKRWTEDKPFKALPAKETKRYGLPADASQRIM